VLFTTPLPPLPFDGGKSCYGVLSISREAHGPSPHTSVESPCLVSQRKIVPSDPGLSHVALLLRRSVLVDFLAPSFVFFFVEFSP